MVILADLEIRISIQMDYLEANSKEASTGWDKDHAGNRASLLLGTLATELSHPRGEGTEKFFHQLPSSSTQGCS